jgi:S1-C subfamily serine protease
MKSGSILSVFLFALIAGAGPLQAGVYKYQDEYGKWHFTDKPPQNAESTVVSTDSGGGESTDLQQQLEERYKPVTEVDRAMLAVVTIETAAGSGSGFFVTDDGYIVTNRHVVRPATSTQARDTKAVLEQRKKRLDEFRAELKYEEERLRENRMTIDEERDYAESGDATATYRAQYERFVERYQKDMERYEDQKAKYRRLEREYRAEKSEFGFTSSLTNFSKKFKVTLKDGKSIRARLIRLSKDHDLALLKLDNYLTPHLAPADGRAPQQGTRVYAIGSPLGISDALTTGIVTKSAPEFLFTDTRILPGNSGGPLIDDSGKVLGVNTAIVTGQDLAAGLGLAIYAQHIRTEFARELRGKF